MDPRDTDDDSILPNLPALDDDGGDEGLDDAAAWQVTLPEQSGDPYDDSYALDVPLEIELDEVNEEGSAVGDEQLGIEDSDHDVPLSDSGGSFIDDGDDESSLFEGDDELGLDPIPREIDDGGLEGLDDSGAELVDLSAFPRMDGAEDDDDEALDVGLELPPLDD